MSEIWKNIEGYPLYEVSNCGRVRTKEHTDTLNRVKKAKIRKPRHVRNGHEYVTLFSNETKRYKLCFIHRLVAFAFIPNPENFPIINHKDCNPSNNHVDNLEWCTHSYNNTYKDAVIKRNSTRLRNNPNGECWKKTAEHRGKPVIQYDTSMKFIKEYSSLRTITLENPNFHSSNISSVLCGNTKTAYGYIWKFKL